MSENKLISLGRVLPTTGKIHQNHDVWSPGGGITHHKGNGI